MGTLNRVVTMNVKAAIKRAGSPTFYRLGKQMAEVVERPPGIGFAKHGVGVNAETCRRHVEDCLSGRRVWRIDYLEGVALVLGVDIAELVSLPQFSEKPARKA